MPQFFPRRRSLILTLKPKGLGQLVIVLLFLGGFSPVWGQYVDFQPRMQQAMQALTEMRYPDLQRLLALERRERPQNRAADYLEAASICVELFVRQGPERYEAREARLEILLERIGQLPDEEPYKKLFLGEIQLGRAILLGKYGNQWKAAWFFSKTYHLLKSNQEQFPRFAPHDVPWGVLQAALGSLPRNYQTLAGLLGFQGDLEKGMELIRRGYQGCQEKEQWQFYRPYHAFVYVFASQQLDRPQAPTFPELGVPVAKSGFLIYLQARLLLEQGQAREALQLLQQRPQGDSYMEFPFLHYLTGKAALIAAPQQASAHFRRYLSHEEETIYRNSTHRYLAWYYLLEDQRDSVAALRQRILTEAPGISGADKQARAEARRGWNIRLVRARLEFDGGAPAKALALLDTSLISENLQPWERVEWHYRRGRAFQRLENWYAARKSYHRALEVPGEVLTYARGNSALQLAHLYDQARRLSAARKYYQRSLEYSNYPFYEGIHQKAKAGLSQLPPS